MKYRKKPIIVDAIQWKGGHCRTLEDFCGMNWGRADVKGVTWDFPEDSEQVVVWNQKERQWICVPVWHYIIRGIAGELYPCDPDIFEATYGRVE